MSVHSKRDTAVKKHLDAIQQIDGGWDHMLDILAVRGIQKGMRENRILQGLTQEEVARRMDVSQSTLSEWETEPYPDYHMSTLRRWALALSMEIDWSVTRKVAEEQEGEEARE